MTKKQSVRIVRILGVFFLPLVFLLDCALVCLICRVNSDHGLTPESIVTMFADAGYEVSDLQVVESYPGPLSDRRIVQGGEFNIELADGTLVRMLVAFYSNGLAAADVTRESKGLNRRMNGGFAYAFRRGRVVLSISTFDRSVAQELGRVFWEK